MAPESFGKYRVVRQLGSGGMAAVYEARDALLDRRVAIKVIHPHLAGEGGFADRFRQEARLVASLRHPNIVQLYDFDILDGQPYMVMEYLEGGTLKDRLSDLRSRGQHLPLGVTSQVLNTLARALNYAHGQGAIHRDIKPANIMLTRQDEPVITDFGIAKLLNESLQISVTGGVIGTPAYMSPEQASGKTVDGRSDQYSLAVMVYEMVAGRVPFIGDTATAILMQHLTETPPPPRGFNPNLPPAAEQALQRALSKDPARRFASVLDFAAAFEAALQGSSPAELHAPAESGLFAATEVDDSLAAVHLPQSAAVPAPTGAATAPAGDQQATLAGSLGAGATPLAPRQPVWRRITSRWTRRRWLGVGATLLVLLGALFFVALGGMDLFAARPATGPAGGFVIAVADFDASQASLKVDFGRRIFDQLESELQDLGGEVRTVRTNQVYPDSDAAKAGGQKAGAAILIWGWYDDLGVSPRIEIIAPPPTPKVPAYATAFVGIARAADPSAELGPSALDLADFFHYLRVPRMVSELDLFVANGPEQLAYIAEAVLALAYQSQGDLETALTLYDKAIAQQPAGEEGSASGDENLSPGLDLVYLQRGLGLAQLDRLPEAIQDLETAAEINPDLHPAHYNLAVLYPEVCAPALQTEAAVAAAEKAAELMPGDLATRLLLAGLYSQVGRIAPALEEAQAALEIDPQNSATLLLLAQLYRAADDADQATASLEAALDVLGKQAQDAAPEDTPGSELVVTPGSEPSAAEGKVEALIALGDAYLQGGRYEEALGAFRQAADLDPDHPDVRRGSGSAYLQLEQFSAAAGEYQRWTELDPQNPGAFWSLGLAYQRQNQSAEMLAAFEQAAQLAPCNPVPPLLLGGYYWEGGDYAQAEQNFAAAVALEPYNATNHYLLGVTLLFQDRLDEAAGELEQALEVDPDLTVARNALAEVYYEQGDYERALNEWQQVAEREVDDPQVHVSLGNAYEKLGQFDQAIAAYQRALEFQMAPQDEASVHTYLGLIYYQRGEYDQARQAYQAAIQSDPQIFLGYSGLGDTLLALGDLQGSAQAYHQALERQEAVTIRAQLALIYTRLGGIDQAILELETALQTEPANALALNQLAGLYSRRGQLDQAEATYQALLSTGPQSSVVPPSAAHLGLGQVAYKRCDLVSMAEHYTQAASLGGESVVYYALPAAAYAAQGASEQQETVLSAVSERFGDDPLAHLLVAEYRWGAGDVQAAGVELAAALEGETLPALFSSIAHYDRGLLQLALGNLTAAESEFQLAAQQYPANAAAVVALGDMALRQNDPQAALQAYDQALALLPEYGAQISGDGAALLAPLVEMRRSLAFAKLGQADQAASAAEEANALAEALVEATPEWPLARFALGAVAYALGDGARAGEQFAAAVACDASLELAATRLQDDLDALR